MALTPIAKFRSRAILATLFFASCFSACRAIGTTVDLCRVGESAARVETNKDPREIPDSQPRPKLEGLGSRVR